MADSSDSRLQGLEPIYDIIIVGGGIHGATLAWEASSRGLSTLLLEKGDFCSGTSANSLKVVHGGIRYLQTLDIRRMRESIKERRALLRIAPHLVRPMKCVMPTYRELKKSRWVMWVAMQIYSILAWGQNTGLAPGQQLSRGGVFSLGNLKNIFPQFSGSLVTGGAYWFDALAHNTERLAMSFIMSAKRKGAHLFNYAKVTNYLIKNNEIKGVKVQDLVTGKEVEALGRAVVDCRGPWASRDEMLSKTGVELKTTRLAKAVNLIIKRKVGELAFGAKPDADTIPEGVNRLLFITPWREGSMIGTWYYLDSGSPDTLSLSKSELQDCLRQVNSIFPTLKLTPDDVSNIHLGLLPVESLNEKTGEPELAGQFSVEVAPQAKGLFALQGVKFTTARYLAEVVIDQIISSSKITAKKSDTSTLPLYGADGLVDIETYRAKQQVNHSELVPASVIDRLVDQYGRNIEPILEFVRKDASMAEPVPGADNTIKAELIYVVENEMVFTLADLIMRRTDIGTFSQPSVQTMNYCADIMASRLGWDVALKQQQIQRACCEYSVLNALR